MKKRLACSFLAILLTFSVSSGVAGKVKPIKVESIDIVAPDTVFGGDEVAFIVNITPSDATDQRVVWSLSPKKAGKISADGVLTLGKVKNPLQVTITVKSKDKGASAEHTLIVNPTMSAIVSWEEFFVKYEEVTHERDPGGVITRSKTEASRGENYDFVRAPIDEYCVVIFTVLPGTTDIIKITMEGTSNKPQIANMRQLLTIGDLLYGIGAVTEVEKIGALCQKIGILSNKKSGSKTIDGLDYDWSRNAESGLTFTITKP